MINIDIGDNASWIKQGWGLPFAYGSDEFLEWLGEEGITLGEFKEMPVYRLALASGSIKEGTDKAVIDSLLREIKGLLETM